MKKINIIKNNLEIQKILKSKERYNKKYFLLLSKNNRYNYPRFCICIGKKNIKLAVTRNKIRRKYKQIIKSIFNEFKNKDYVFIVKKVEYKNIKWEILLKDIKIVLNKNNENKPKKCKKFNS